MTLEIRQATLEDQDTWFYMRKGLWPHVLDHELRAEMSEMLTDSGQVIFLAFVQGRPAGMLETRIRDYAEGCDTDRVGYLEGWFVYEEFRGTGVAQALVNAAEDWARVQGCTEMASDTWLDNEVSIRAHQKLGYQEVERLVHFAKKL